jgi:hypothetical protein
MGSSASVFRMSMSRVPWTRSLGLSAIDAFLQRFKRKNTFLLLIVKRSATTVLTLRDNRKGDGRSLRYGLSAPPTASQAFVPGVVMEAPMEAPHVL